MLFLEEKGPAVRVACAAGLLVLGEAVGFTLAQQGFAEVWPWMGFAAFVGGLAAYGLLKLFAQDAEGDGGLGGGAGL